MRAGSGQDPVWAGRVVREARRRVRPAAGGLLGRLVLLVLLMVFVRTHQDVDQATAGALLGGALVWLMSAVPEVVAAVREARQVRMCGECRSASASLDAAGRRWAACVARRHVLPLPEIAGMTATTRTTARTGTVGTSASDRGRS